MNVVVVLIFVKHANHQGKGIIYVVVIFLARFFELLYHASCDCRNGFPTI